MYSRVIPHEFEHIFCFFIFVSNFFCLDSVTFQSGCVFVSVCICLKPFSISSDPAANCSRREQVSSVSCYYAKTLSHICLACDSKGGQFLHITPLTIIALVHMK